MKKKHKKKLNIRKTILFIIFIALIVILVRNITTSDKVTDIINNNPFIQNDNGYSIIKQDKNEKYSGEGQEKVSNKDGYYTTFTTTDPHKKTYIEYKQNGDASWSKNTYWNDYMENSGCGITALSVILSGYGKSVTPEDLRNKYYPVIDYESLDNEFSNSYGIKATGFFYDSTHLSKKYINEHLLSNRPVLICVWNKPNENRWTTTSHYMVLLASDGDDMVYISNPNGGKNDSKSSGWYKYKEVIPYIAKALFIESYE